VLLLPTVRKFSALIIVECAQLTSSSFFISLRTGQYCVRMLYIITNKYNLSEQTRFNRQPSAVYSYALNSIEPQQSKCFQTLQFFGEPSNINTYHCSCHTISIFLATTSQFRVNFLLQMQTVRNSKDANKRSPVQ